MTYVTFCGPHVALDSALFLSIAKPMAIGLLLDFMADDKELFYGLDTTLLRHGVETLHNSINELRTLDVALIGMKKINTILS